MRQNKTRNRSKGKVCAYYCKRIGKWRVQDTRPDGARATDSYHTEEVAREVAEQLRAQYAGETETVAEAIELFIAELHRRSLKEETIKTERYRLHRMFPKRQDQLISELHPIICERLYEELQEQGLS